MNLGSNLSTPAYDPFEPRMSAPNFNPNQQFGEIASFERNIQKGKSTVQETKQGLESKYMQQQKQRRAQATELYRFYKENPMTLKPFSS